MNEANIRRACFELRKVLTIRSQELGVVHPWLWEEERWKELVFALLSKSTRASEAEVRLLTERMAELDLLHVDRTARLGADKDSDEAREMTRRVVDLMIEGGFTKEEAERGFAAIRDAATGLLQHHKGKVQLYLRKVGESMLDQLPQNFAFSSLSKGEVADAFTYWLQNALNMPLSLVDESVRSFARTIDVSPAELIAAADRIDMNLALMDDLAHLRMAEIDRPST
jgi:hypothetical protein